MSEASVDPDIIKRTQDMLGQIINAPALTDKLLNRPPVQFIQDIVKAVIKKTNFLQGLYSDEELTSSYLKDGRENKTLFIKKLVTAVYIAVKRTPDVRVSKILAGQEADKTNLLLQALAEAINANADNNEVVRRTLQSLGDGNENEGESRSRDRKESESTDKRRSKEERSSKSHERDDGTAEKKSSSRDSGSKDQTDGDSSMRKRRPSKPTDEDGNDDRKASKQDDDDDNDRKDEEETKTRRSTRPSSAKGPRKQPSSSSHHRPASPKDLADPSPSRQPVVHPHSTSTDRDNNDDKPLVRPGTANTAAKSRKPMKGVTSDELPGTSGRIPSAVPRGQGSLIIESKDSRDNPMNNNDNDDDDNFLIQEEKTNMSKSFKQDDADGRGGGMGDDDDDNDQDGALVKQMRDTKRKLEHGSEMAGQRSDVKTVSQNDAQRRREREKIQKDVDKLRETIQSLTKSVVPLGKILEYLQEDYEMMAREMQQYTDEYKRTVVDLRKEKFTTDQNLEPLRAALLDLDDQIADMKNRIIFMKKKINHNEKANGARLLEIIRKNK